MAMLALCQKKNEAAHFISAWKRLGKNKQC